MVFGDHSYASQRLLPAAKRIITDCNDGCDNGCHDDENNMMSTSPSSWMWRRFAPSGTIGYYFLCCFRTGNRRNSSRRGDGDRLPCSVADDGPMKAELVPEPATMELELLASEDNRMSSSSGVDGLNSPSTEVVDAAIVIRQLNTASSSASASENDNSVNLSDSLVGNYWKQDDPTLLLCSISGSRFMDCLKAKGSSIR